MTFEAADLREAPLPPAQVALVANLMHHLDARQGPSLLERVHDALAPGGSVAIWEIEAPRPGSRVSHGDVVALFFRLTSTGETPPGDVYDAQLRTVGFRDVRVRRSARLPGRVLVTATK